MRCSIHALSWRWRSRRFRRAPTLPAILLYHSVSVRERDPLHLAVTPARFDAQLGWLACHATPLPLADFVQHHHTGTLPRNAVAVTFDDGYADNLDHAEPQLQRHGIPATVFAATDCIGAQNESWWEELDAILLETPRLPPSFRHDGFACEVEVAANPDRRRWTVLVPPATPRERAFLAASAHARIQSRAARLEFLDALRAWSGRAPAVRRGRAFAGWEDLRGAQRRGVMAVGAHTRSHPALGSRPAPEQASEIAESCATVARELELAAVPFAYPFGTFHDFTPMTRRLVARHGAPFACANMPARLGRDRWQLPRLLVRNWEVAEFARRLGR
jgi:peptidoglycan/xylan/chitin deacetylase (PgdA/CDA1 family)